MSVRKVLATVALAGGLSGAGFIAANPSLVLGSTADAGVVTVCINQALCPPSGPIQSGVPTPTTTTTPLTSAATP